MAEPGFPIAAAPYTVTRCPECATPLAADQRYCVQCGARCVPLAGDLFGRATALGSPLIAEPGLAAEIESRAGAFLASLPPRAAALAVMSMLAFGVVVGSGATSLASPSSPVIVAYGPSAGTPAPTAGPTTGGGSGNGGGSGGGGGGGTTTVVQTVAAQTITAPGGGGGGGGGGGPAAPTTPTGPTYPPVKHVFMVMLSTEGFKALFGPGSAYTYLNRTLRRQGELLDNYYGVAGSPLANEIALLSGQGPTAQTMQDCPQYTAVSPGTIGKGKQVQGVGCLYPAATANLPDQLVANGQTWKGYIEGMDTIAPPSAPATTTSSSTTTTSTSAGTTTTSASGGTTSTPSTAIPTPAGTTSTPSTTIPTPAGTITAPPASVPGPTGAAARADIASTSTTTAASGPTTTGPGGTGTAPSDTQTVCRHPAVGASDTAQTASTASPYVTWRNPFVYFASITNSTECALADVGTGQLAKDLKHEATTPALAYIAPSPCDDGQLVACAPGQAPDARSAAAAADAFLKTTITEIEASPAYANGNGLIAITAENAPQSGPGADPSACCGNPVYPNLPATATTGSSTTTTGATTTGAPGATTGSGTTTTGTTTSGTTTGAATGTPTTSTTSSTSTTTTSPLTGGSTTPTGGGGQIGLLLISKYVKPGSEDTLDYFNHYSLLGSVEQLFSLNRIGYAADPQLTLFQPGVVYNNYKP